MYKYAFFWLVYLNTNLWSMECTSSIPKEKPHIGMRKEAVITLPKLPLLLTLKDTQEKTHTLTTPAAQLSTYITTAFKYKQEQPIDLPVTPRTMDDLIKYLELLADNNPSRTQDTIRKISAYDYTKLTKNVCLADYIDAQKLLNFLAQTMVHKLVRLNSIQRHIINKLKVFQRNYPYFEQLVEDYYIKYLERVSSWKTKKILRGHSGPVSSAIFSSNDAYIITASFDNTARVWNAQTGKCLYTLNHEKIVNSANFSPDNQYIVTTSNDKTARIWHTQTGTLVHTLRGHTAPVLSAEFSGDGKHVTTASDDNTARIWDTQTGTLLTTLNGHTAHVLSAAFSPDTKQIVTASLDNTARIWETSTGTLKHTLRGHHDNVYAAAFSPNGGTIVTASRDHAVRVWNAETGTIIITLSGHDKSVIYAAYSYDGKRVISTSNDGTVRIWNIHTGKAEHILTAPSSSFSSATFSHDNNAIVTTSWDKTARIWYQPNVYKFLTALHKASLHVSPPTPAV